MKHLYIIMLIIGTLGSITSVGQSYVFKKEVQKSTEQIIVFPNPTVDHFSLQNLDANVEYITINNIIGKQIKRIAVRRADQRFDVSELTRGVYIIRVFDSGDQLVKAVRLSKA